MTYKETLFFIGKCLTINHEEHNYILVENALRTETVDWDSIVKVSTAHFVFPALYCNLKRANFLHYLPQDLVEYMKHITDLNRERNQQIIEQAKEINELLLANNITPIFLKGTSNLLEGIYEDIAERMVGDIDFIVSKKQIDIAYTILQNKNYKKQNIDIKMPPNHRHYPRLVHENKIAAIELHKEILREQFAEKFNYDLLIPKNKNENNFYSLNKNHQLISIILTKQINDFEDILKTFSLRNMYDIFLLSKHTNTLKAIKEFPSFYNKSNSVLALASYLFNKPSSLIFEKNNKTEKHVISVMKGLTKNKKFIKLYINLKQKTPMLIKSIYKKEYRKFIKSRLKPNA
jgi:hypothetical protein